MKVALEIGIAYKLYKGLMNALITCWDFFFLSFVFLQSRGQGVGESLMHFPVETML